MLRFFPEKDLLDYSSGRQDDLKYYEYYKYLQGDNYKMFNT